MRAGVGVAMELADGSFGIEDCVPLMRNEGRGGGWFEGEEGEVRREGEEGVWRGEEQCARV